MKVFLALPGYVDLGKFLELSDPQFPSLQTWKVSPSPQDNACKELSSVPGTLLLHCCLSGVSCLRGTGKEPCVFRGRRGYSLKTEHRDVVWALASELGNEEYVKFGCLETGGGGSREGHSRLEALVPSCIPAPSLRSGTP